jgi:hypothetical protein
VVPTADTGFTQTQLATSHSYDIYNKSPSTVTARTHIYRPLTPYIYFPMRPLWLHHISRYYLTNGTVWEGGGGVVVEHKMCVFISSTNLSETFLRRIQRDIIINVHTSFFKTPVTPVRFSKNPQICSFLKICPELLHADRLTDMTKLIEALRIFSNAPKNTTAVH